MDYSKLSDFEINKAVAECMGVKSNIELDVVYNEYFEELDYCNNPSDAWPIIIENKIEMRWQETVIGEWFCGKSSPCGDFYKPWASNDNPLRAAMICYLMMKEAGNA